MLRDCQTTAVQRWRILTTNLQKDENDPLKLLINLQRPPIMPNPLGPRNPMPNPLGQPNVLQNPLGQPGALLVGLPKPDLQKELFLKQIEYLRLSGAILKEMDQYDRIALNTKLRDPNPTTRWLAIQSVLMRRLHCEEELFNRLKDPVPHNRAAAHDALVRVTRGTDFGPAYPVGSSPVATARAQEEALANWRQWQRSQDETPPGVNGR